MKVEVVVREAGTKIEDTLHRIAVIGTARGSQHSPLPWDIYVPGVGPVRIVSIDRRRLLGMNDYEVRFTFAHALADGRTAVVVPVTVRDLALA